MHSFAPSCCPAAACWSCCHAHAAAAAVALRIAWRGKLLLYIPSHQLLLRAPPKTLTACLPLTFTSCYRRLGYNQLTGGLPPGFAANGSFTKLRVLSFAGNTGLGGTLPPEFGDAATALPLLQTLDVSSCGLTGTLPTQWGAGLQSLQSM